MCTYALLPVTIAIFSLAQMFLYHDFFLTCIAVILLFIFQPTLEQRFESYQNYIDLFNLILGKPSIRLYIGPFVTKELIVEAGYRQYIPIVTYPSISSINSLEVVYSINSLEVVHYINSLEVVYSINSLEVVYSMNSLEVVYSIYSLEVVYSINSLEVVYSINSLEVVYSRAQLY